MNDDFDRVIDRRGGDSLKWNIDVNQIPMWYADADVASPPAVIAALVDRAAHGVYGYAQEPAALRTIIVERMRRLYGWHILPEDIVPVPGIIPGFNLASRAFGAPGAGTMTWGGDDTDINEANCSRRRALSCFVMDLTSA